MDSPSSADRISSLPKNVIEAILVCLPIKDAVRTSILSRSWRYGWSTLSRITIDSKQFSGLEDAKFEYIVDQILLLHCGPINHLEISVDICNCDCFDRWILFVSRNGIKSFVLHIWEGEIYKLPSCFFSCVDLTYLELYGCKLSPPPSFKGFSKLELIILQEVALDDNWLQLLISKCPLLKTLELYDITGCTRLRISLPQLEELEIEGEFEDLHLDSTPLLATASIDLVNAPYGSVEGRVIEKVLGSLPRIQWLNLINCTIRNLSNGDIPVHLPVRCPLEHLLICMNFEDKQELLAAFCIFRSSLVLQKLDIKAISDKNTARISADAFWGVEDFDCPFSHLQVVEVTDFAGITSELKFIEHVLANAHVLEKLHIKFKQDVGDVLQIFRELIKFRRSSTKAEIIVPE